MLRFLSDDDLTRELQIAEHWYTRALTTPVHEHGVYATERERTSHKRYWRMRLLTARLELDRRNRSNS